MTRFYYFASDRNPKQYITMKRAAPEWCNLDCPEIYVESDDEYDGWLVNSGGLYIESVPERVQLLFVRFVKRSERAFYHKYPQCYDGRYGFTENLVRYNSDDCLWRMLPRSVQQALLGLKEA